MNNALPIIDLEFGTAQLSGNQAMFIRLLEKLAAEYEHLDARLGSALAAAQWDEVRILVHTLKGVSGNLGCSALHEQARIYEESIKRSHEIPHNHQQLLETHEQTLAAITKLSQAEAAPAESATAAEPAAADKSALLQALEQHEFIPQEKLDGWLQRIGLQDDAENALREAIDELDYEAAIALVKA